MIDQLPAEQVVYVGDTANGPYGPQRIADVRRHALAVGDALVERGVKLLVIACNTASAACLADARERYAVPVVEVLRPAVRRAVATTRNGRIGVIGTRATIASGAYDDAFAAAPDVKVTSVACPRFVDFVERGMTSGRQVLGLAQGYLEPLQRAQVDTVVLGCTHYPLLAGVLQIVLGPGRHARLQRRGDRQGRRAGAHGARPGPRARPARRTRRTSSSPPATPSRSAGSGGGSSAREIGTVHALREPRAEPGIASGCVRRAWRSPRSWPLGALAVFGLVLVPR